jgi:hypothetical protein
MRALLAYRHELDRVQPSARLDDRLEAAIRLWSADRRRSSPRRILYWAAAAAAAAAAILVGLYLHPPHGRERYAVLRPAGEEYRLGADVMSLSVSAPSGRPSQPSVRVAPSGAGPQPSGVSALSEVRSHRSGVGPLSQARPRPAPAGALPEVRPQLATSLPPGMAVFRVRASLGSAAAAKYGPAESKYWVDVGVGNDGALRIVRVLPAGGPERVVP